MGHHRRRAPLGGYPGGNFMGTLIDEIQIPAQLKTERERHRPQGVISGQPFELRRPPRSIRHG